MSWGQRHGSEFWLRARDVGWLKEALPSQPSSDSHTLGVVACACSQTRGRWRQGDLEFKIIFGYNTIWRSVWVTWDPVTHSPQSLKYGTL